MDYLKTVVPSQLIAEKGSNMVVINPGSANVKIGLASWQTPVVVPHCIAHYMRGPMDEEAQIAKRNREQVFTSPVSSVQQSEREEAYHVIVSHLKLQPENHERVKESWFRKKDHSDGYNSQSKLNEETIFSWTHVREEKNSNSPDNGIDADDEADINMNEEKPEGMDEVNDSGDDEINDCTDTFRSFICGDEALKIAPDQPYFLRHPIRRGHLNVSQFYSVQQISEDLYRIWDWILREKLRISQKNRHMFSAVLVVSETFDNREMKEMLSVVLRDLQFNSAVIHQESLSATFGNGVSTSCVVNIGAQVASVLCIEDGVAVPATGVTLPFGGEDISRCLLWVQQRRQTWPPIDTDPMAKPIDLLMLNRLKETQCKIKDGELNAFADVHCFKANQPSEVYRVHLSALNVPSMGLFYPSILVPDEYPPPPRPWFHDYEDMLEDSSHTEFVRRSDGPEIFFPGYNCGLAMPDSSESYPQKFRKEENLDGLAQAITNSILSTGRLDVQKKLFTSIQLVGGVALTKGLVGVVEERVLHAIPANEAIDTVEVLQQRTDPLIVSWKGGAILGILDYFSRDQWIHREDWVHGGSKIGSGRKYRDSHLLQTQAFWYINS